jgi:diguanylate cyclase (GGDEF)-like protein
VLKEVGSRLLNSVREMDIVARLGGDEFAVIASEFHRRDEIDNLASRIIDSIGKPFCVGPGHCSIGVSIGICVYHGDELPVEDLVKNADQAMYRVKKGGKNSFYYYSPE